MCTNEREEENQRDFIQHSVSNLLGAKDFVRQLPDDFAGQRPESEKKKDDEDEEDHTDDDRPLEVTPDNVAEGCPGRGEPEKRRLRSTRKNDWVDARSRRKTSN